MVCMVCLQTSLLGQSQAVDAVRLEDIDGQIAGHRNNHQRHKQVVATGYLGYQEDTCQRGVHHARHHSRHTQQRKILLRHVDTYLVHVPQSRKEKTRKTSYEQRWSKRTATAAATVRCRGGKHLGQQHQTYI